MAHRRRCADGGSRRLLHCGPAHLSWRKPAELAAYGAFGLAFLCFLAAVTGWRPWLRWLRIPTIPLTK